MRASLFIVLLVAGCGGAASDARSCATLPASLSASTPALPTLVLVTLDGVRGEDLFGHPKLLPNLQRLIDRGVALDGSSIVASGPRFVSLPGYREIMTGRRGVDCLDNRCPAIAEPTLLDELRVAGRLASDDVVTIASWEIIERAASIVPTAMALSTGRHGGATRAQLAISEATRRDLAAGARASAWPGHGDYRPDALTAALALDLVAARVPRVLWVGLGDTDEEAHRGDYDGYLAALVAADAFLGRLVSALPADAILVVTADHGRSANFRDHGDSPESSGVWLVASGGAIPPRGLVRATTRYRLADIAPTLRALLHLDRDDSPRAGRRIVELSASADTLASRL